MATSFDLVVGINESATLDNFKRQLSGIIEQVEGELPKLKLGFDSSSLDKDFKSQLTGLLAGIQSAATSAIAPLQEIQNLVREINSKDFTINFNYTDAHSGAERVGEYVQRVKAYISDLGEATKEIPRLSGLTPGQVAGKAIDANQLENYKRFLEILESVEKMSARLDKVGTISGAKGIAKEAEQMWSELIPWIERAKELGIMDQNTKFALFPEVPESAANTMMSLADIIKNMLQPMQDMQREADGIVASEEKVAGSAESTTQKIEEQAAAYQKAAETMRGGGSSISGGVGGIGDDGAEKLRDELKIVDEYYARMKDLVKYREDITLTGDGYTSQSGYYSAFVNQLNSAKSAYDGLVASLHANVDAENASRLSLEDKDKVLTRIIEKQQELDRVTAAAEGKDAVRRAKDDISSTQQSIRALEEMERQERAVAEAAQSVVTPMQEQVNALTGVDNAAKSAADSANAMQMAWAMQKEEVKAQAEADKILAEEERAVAEAAQSVVTPMQEQVNALTGVDNAAKSAADSASAMQMAWAMQKEEAQEVAAAIKAVDDYYKEMSSVIGNKDISFDGEKWVASNEAMQEQADRLNTLKTEMEQYTVATNESTATSAQQEAATKRQAAAQKEYEDTLRNTATSALSSYSSAMKQSEQDLRNFGAAQYSANADSRKAFDDMKAAAENMRTAFSTYMSDKSVGNLNNFITAQKEYNAVAERSRAIITANGDAHKTFGGIVAGLGSKFSYLFSATRIMMAVYRTMKQMVKGAIELDSALTQLQIVTGESNAQMERFANTLAEAAQRVAVPIKDLIEAATVFARLGYSSGESATLAEFTAMLQNVGNIDAGDAQNAVTAIVKAYGIGVDEIETVMDKMVKVGNNFPISVSQIADGMNNASSALAAAGNSFEESIALLTAANTTLQNASKASTGLRTLAARIRNTKAELDELGEEAITEAKYEEIVQMLTKYHVSLTDINGEYRSTYDIMKDIAAEWDKMTSMEQAALATQLAGTRQQTVFYSVINQFKEATGAMDAMADSAGTLSQAYDVYLDSTQAHINQFKAAFQQFGYNLFENDVLRFFIDIGTGIVNALNKVDGLIDKLGGLKTVIIAIGAVIATIKFDSIILAIGSIGKAVAGLTTNIARIGPLIVNKIRDIGAAFSLVAETAIGSASLIMAGFAAFIGAMALIDDAMNTSDKEAMDAANQSMKAYEDERAKVEELSGELNTTKERIDELKAKGSLTLVEQNELENLERTNTLLETELKYREAIAQQAAAAAAEDAANALTNRAFVVGEDYAGNTTAYEQNFWTRWAGLDYGGRYADRIEYVTALYDRLQELEQQKANLENELFNTDPSDTKRIAELNSQIESVGTQITSVRTEWTAAAEGIITLNNSLHTSTGTVVSGYEDLVARIDEYFEHVASGSDKAIKKQKEIEDLLARPSLYNYVERAKELASEMNGITLDDLTSQFPVLANAAEAAGIDLQALVDIINSLAGTKNFDEMRNQILAKSGGANSFADLFQMRDWLSELSDEEIEILYGIYESQDTSSWSFADWVAALATAKEEAEEASHTIEAAFESIKEESDVVAKAMSEQSSNGSISVETYDALMKASGAYANVLTEEGGAIRIDTEAAREMLKANVELKNAEIELQKAIDIAKWKENSKEIDELTSRYNELAEADKLRLESLREENRVIGQNVDRYNVMQSELYDTISAYKQWQDVQNGPESGDMYDNTQKALEQIKEGIESGKTGTTKFQAAVELLVPEAKQEDVEAYVSTLERYITEDASGIGNFLSDMISAGLMERNGDNFELVAGTTVQDIIDAFEEAGHAVTPELLKAIFGELEEYDFHFEWDDEDFNIDFSAGLTSIGEFDQAIQECNSELLTLLDRIIEIDSSPDLTPEMKADQIAEVNSQIDELTKKRDGLVSARDALINADASESTLSEIQKIIDGEGDIAGKLDELAAKSMGDLGSVEAYQHVQLLYGALVNLNNLQIQDKHYTVYEHTVSKGRAAAKGMKDAPGGDALVGELGRELVVSGDKYYTVGDTGAEFTYLKPGDIVFSHEDTEKIFGGRNGARGRALASGNAFALNNSRVRGGGNSSWLAQFLDTGTGRSSSSGVSYVESVASAFDDVTESIEDATEAAEELDDELKEMLDNMKKEMDEVIGNYEHSIFLLEKTGGSAESQIAIYEEMMKAVNDQANKYRGLGLDDNNDYIQDLQKQWWDYHDKIIDLNADMYDKIIDAHENSMSLREHWIEDAYARGDKAEAQRLQEEQIAEYEAVQRELHEKAEYYRSLGYKETDDEISELANKWWDYHDKINDIREDMFERMIQEHEDAVSVLENSVTLTENWLDNAESRGDRSGIIKYTNDIVNYYKEMQDEIHRQAEDYRARGYSDLSDEVSALSDKWWEYQRNITDAMSSAFEQIVSEAHNSLDEIQGVYDTLIKASEEYAENGFITVDTFQEIAKMGVQYMSLLRNQNGELVISEQNINAIIAAKTRQLAVDTALDYVQKISTASKNNDITALKNLINATSLATTTTWDLVYAQLYAAGLSGDDYAAARRNIDNMRLLAENAVAGIGQVATTASKATSSASGKANKALQEQKEALDDILKYVKEMIKQEIKDQVDALKEQQKAYKEIVDLQKKSLDLEKEKDSYTKDVKDKTNEIAKLQQKIYMLDLDNSREAQAEKAKLQEDLAKMQGDLADKQADKARDTTKDMLDDMAEAYSKEKDEEIKALEDSISSEEKLYQKAIERIRTGWDTLYDDLIKWNTQYGNVTNAEISDAWSKAQKAAEKYGDYLTALEAITARLAKESGNVGSGLSSGGSSYSGAGWGSNNGTPGKVGDSAAYIDTIKHLARRMKTNSDDWHTADVETRKALADDNLVLGKQIQAELRKFDPTAVVERDSNGVWYVTTNGKRMKLFGEFVPDVYHSGGIVGGFGTAKQDETFAKLQNGEMVLNDQQQKRMIRILDDSETIFTKMSSMFGLNSSSSPLTRLRDMFTGNEIQAAFAGGDNVTITVAPEINVSVASASDQAEVRRLSKQISDITIDNIIDAFAKRGKLGGNRALLKP